MATSSISPSRTASMSADVDKIIVQLRLAQDYGSGSPHVLMLINDLVCTYEDKFEKFEAGLSEQGARQLGMIRTLHEHFLADLVEYAEMIRCENGEFPNGFFSFVDKGPYVQPSLAA
ncbi:hypothetical protein [Maricaulis sp.]|uniref:hypothetical protein n=1 Tax=unclassified Maricaulis TaxID=2632371 RepID=UPI001B02CBD2|nr:hypothetical protein [Maricaulis sp.]MBO6796720.1 hypothetical protein [Maricaulis sp.]